MTMAVTQLGYIGLKVKDIDAWHNLAGPILGMEVRERERKNQPLYLRLDEHHHRFALTRAADDEVDYIGWEVAGGQALDEFGRRLAARGVETRRGTPKEVERRKVIAFIAFRDPEGFPVEVFHGPLMDGTALKPGRGLSGFNCGGLGLGHVALVCRDTAKMADFYVNELGFRISDYITWDEADAIFLHCNPRHHSLALINECYGMKAGQLHHFMVETLSIDDVGRAYDLVAQHDMPLILTLGRHTNDHMMSFYLASPSGFAIEYGWGGRLIDDSTWQVSKYDSPKIWGHELVT
jgi:2,3-dihydroxybiphenyl 1,2-dioxygenase